MKFEWTRGGIMRLAPLTGGELKKLSKVKKEVEMKYKAIEETRTIKLQVWVSPQELAHLVKYATKHGETQSRCVRRLIRAAK